MAQAYGAVFGLPQDSSAPCAAILSIVGLLVLYQVCKPFDFFRRVIWFAMGVCLVLCFTALGGFFSLEIWSGSVILVVMATLLIMTPTVFFAIQRVFRLRGPGVCGRPAADPVAQAEAEVPGSTGGGQAGNESASPGGGSKMLTYTLKKAPGMPTIRSSVPGHPAGHYRGVACPPGRNCLPSGRWQI